MEFKSLLEPVDLSISAGEQQRRAGERFPALVQASRLKLWSPSLVLSPTNRWIILGLAASYSIPELRLADVLEARAADSTAGDIYVFDIDGLPPSEVAGTVFSRLTRIVATPIAAVGEGSACEAVAQGGRALELAIQWLGLSVTLAELID